MKIVRTIPEIRSWVQRSRDQKAKIVFVPTMGALHEGHLDLIRRARKIAGENDRVVVSIFINPTQFNQKSDFQKYPHRLRQDASLCKKQGVDLVFAPSAKSMYPSDFSTFVEEQKISILLCGKTRPGHFRGVCTVVAKLFNLVQPDIAIFGKKDAQQAAVIMRMVRDLNFPVQIIVAPTIREKDGLAMSSRNERLNKEERSSAPIIFGSLKKTRDLFLKGEHSANKLRSLLKSELNKIKDAKIDYIEIVDARQFEPVIKVKSGDLLAVAIFAGNTRLIDNITF